MNGNNVLGDVVYALRELVLAGKEAWGEDHPWVELGAATLERADALFQEGEPIFTIGASDPHFCDLLRFHRTSLYWTLPDATGILNKQEEETMATMEELRVHIQRAEVWRKLNRKEQTP